MSDESPLMTHVNSVIMTVCLRYAIKMSDLLAAKYRGIQRLRATHKTKPYAAARLDIVRLLRSTVTSANVVHMNIGDMTPISYPAVARLLGGLNHSTLVMAVNNAVKRGEPEVLNWAEYLEGGEGG